MNNSILSLVTFVASLHGAFSASISTYEVDLGENIQSNLIDDSIEGLTPPKPLAQDHYVLESGKGTPEAKNPYIVEISSKYLKFQTTGFPAQYIKLTKGETEGIQNVSLSIVDLLVESKLASQSSEDETPDRSQVNPVITLSNSGISLRFMNATAAEEEEEKEDTSETNEDRHILWEFLRNYARNIFLEKLRELKVTEKLGDELQFSPGEDSFGKFLNTLWKIAMLSVDYAEANFGYWTTPESETTTEEAEDRTRSTIATIFAYEEPAPFHVFPSQESEYRRKDTDSLFYGRGII